MNDFRDLLTLLNKHAVRYLVVGGHAYSVYREPRATKDLDIFIDASEENSVKVFTALDEFGAPLAGYTSDDFAHEDGTWYVMGKPPARIVLQRIDGKVFSTAWATEVNPNCWYSGARHFG